MEEGDPRHACQLNLGVSSHCHCPSEPKTLAYFQVEFCKPLLEASVLGVLPSLVWGPFSGQEGAA